MLIKDQNEKIDELKTSLEGKAPSNNLQELRQLIKNCATSSSLEILKSRISECAGKYQLEEIQKTQIFLRKKIEKCPKTKILNETLNNLKDEFYVKLEKDFINREMFFKEKDGLLRKSMSEEEKILEISNKIERTEGMLMKKITNLKKHIDSRPWSGNIQEIHTLLAEKSSIKDFKAFKSEIDVVQSQSLKRLNNFQNNITTFETIVARFDEVLLLKAEKDEITRIEQKISSLVEKTVFEEKTNPLASSIEKIQDAILKLIQSGDIMDNHLNSVSIKCNTLVKENIDVSLLSKTLQDLREVVNRKANKEDIYEIYDIMGRKIEIYSLAESTNVFKKQLELCAVLVLTLCKTLVKNGENPIIIKKTREELLTSLNSLVN